MQSNRRFGFFLAVAGLLLIGGTTLVPLPQQRAESAATPLWCLVCGEYGGVDVLNNILLFIPLSVGLRLYGYRAAAIVMNAALLSFSVELLQLTVIPGRDASLSDLVTNTLGGWLGALAGARWAQLVLPAPSTARALVATAASAWLGVQAATAVLLRPWAPDELRGAARAREIPGRVPFNGAVISVVVSGFTLHDKLASIPELSSRVQHGDVELEARLLSGSHVAAWSPVVEILGPEGSVLSLDAVGRDLVFHPPMQSSRLRLRRPGLRLKQALPPAADVPLQVTAKAGGDTISASWSIAEGPIFRSLQVLGPSLGWSLITPFRYAFGAEVRWITGMWIAGWLAVIGYWWAASRAPPVAAVLSPVLLLFAGLVLVSLAWGYSPSHWTEWLAGLAGLGIGYAGHHLAAYFAEGCDSLSIKESC